MHKYISVTSVIAILNAGNAQAQSIPFSAQPIVCNIVSIYSNKTVKPSTKY